MGVQGLCSFFDENSELSPDYKLHDTKVVIDGNNLLHYLFFTEGIDCIYGGGYSKFADAIRKYFGAFFACKVQPIVLFDGGCDPSDRKLKTTRERTNLRIKLISNFSKKRFTHMKVLPILAINVMRDVLRSLNIEFAQCDFEADDQITAISNYFKCPVISQDSDFYIFDVHHGFIRLDSIDFHVKKENEKNNEFHFLDCNIYFIDNLLQYFPGIEKNILPLFGTLIGNDYVTIDVFENFYCNIKLPKFNKKLKVNQRHRKMIGLLGWLQNRSYNNAVQFVMNHLKEKDRKYVSSIIELAVNSYKVPQCGTSEYSLQKCLEILPSARLTTCLGNKLPDWFIKNSRLGNISPLILNAVSLLRVFLPLPLQDVHITSANACSLPIRQVLYGIVLSDHGSSSNNPEKDINVVEFDQHNGSIRKYNVEPIFKVDSLDALANMEKSDAQCFVASVLGQKVDYFQAYPKSLQLLFGSIRFWITNSLSKPTKAFIDCLILHMILVFFSKSVYKLALDKSSTKIDDIMNDIKREELEIFSSNMRKYDEKPCHNNANPVLTDVIHNFSELQCCVLYSLMLNDLLDSPFVKVKVHHFFQGILLYNLTKDVMKRKNPDLFLAELLGRQSKLLELFLEMKTVLFLDLNLDSLGDKNLQKIKKRKKRSKAKIPCRRVTYNNPFEPLQSTSKCNN